MVTWTCALRHVGSRHCTPALHLANELGDVRPFPSPCAAYTASRVTASAEHCAESFGIRCNGIECTGGARHAATGEASLARGASCAVSSLNGDTRRGCGLLRCQRTQRKRKRPKRDTHTNATACGPTPYATLHMLSFGHASQLGGRCRASIARRASACLRFSSAPPTSAASKPAARHSTPLIAHDLSSIPTASARFSSPLAYSVEVEGHALGATEAAGTEESAAGRRRFAASSCIARVCRDQERGD